MRASALAFLLLASGCATLDTSAMTPACREIYNACLTGCSGPTPPPTSVGDPSAAAGGRPRDTQPSPGWADSATPSCVDHCNEAAKVCQQK